MSQSNSVHVIPEISLLQAKMQNFQVSFVEATGFLHSLVSSDKGWALKLGILTHHISLEINDIGDDDNDN